jgi:hypothetical protein
VSTIRTGAAGKNLVASIVESQLKSDWQNIDAENDDAIDGLIFLRYREEFSGRTIFAQVKSGKAYKKPYANPAYSNLVAVDLGAEYLAKHRQRWNALPGPVVLIYVLDPANRLAKIYWQDLRSETSYSATNRGVVLIPSGQTLGSHMKGQFRRMCGSVADSSPLQVVDLRDARSTLASPNFERKRARVFYKDWAASAVTFHPTLGKIDVTNLGWRHITRKSRRLENIHNSFMLLEAARRMISLNVNWRQLGGAKKRERNATIDIVDHIGLRAIVQFRQRAPGPVQVILRRTRSISQSTGAVASRLAFLSVHELIRGNSQYYG